MEDMTDWRHWVKGLIAALINGLANGVVLVVAAPETFNLEAGFRKLWMTSLVLGLLGAANYLKKSPLPGVTAGLLAAALLLPLSGCSATPPPNLTPTAQQAFKNHELQKALDFARDVAVDAEAAGALSTATTRKMVLWHKASISLVHAQGTGWSEQLRDITRALTSVNSTFSSDEKNLLTPYLDLVMKALGGFSEPTAAARVEGSTRTRRTAQEEVYGLEPERTRPHERRGDRGVSVRIHLVTREGRRVVGCAPAVGRYARGQLAA